MGMMQDLAVPVLENAALGGGSFVLSLGLPPRFPAPKAGNFLMVSCGDHPELTLRRPMAFFDFQKTKSRAVAKVLYAAHGRGTRRMAELRKGDAVSILAPLGNAFSKSGAKDRTLIVAGGIGIAPFLLWWGEAAAAVRKNTAVVFGFRNRDQAAMAAPLKSLKPAITLDEKTRGFAHGNVMDYVRANEAKLAPTRILTCGPNPMMAAVADYAKDRGIPCEVSLEAKMGCGMGVCLSCVTDFPHVAQGENDRILLCQKGPVFSIIRG